MILRFKNKAADLGEIKLHVFHSVVILINMKNTVQFWVKFKDFQGLLSQFKDFSRLYMNSRIFQDKQSNSRGFQYCTNPVNEQTNINKKDSTKQITEQKYVTKTDRHTPPMTKSLLTLLLHQC